MITRRMFVRNNAMAIGFAIALPELVLADRKTKAVRVPSDYWVTLMYPDFSSVESRLGLMVDVNQEQIQSIHDQFTEPLPLTVDFGSELIGWLSQVRLAEDGSLQGRIEVPSFNSHYLDSHPHVAPALMLVPRSRKGVDLGPARMVAVGLTKNK